MAHLLQLSRFIVIPILMEWTNFKEIGVLDSAVCNSVLRPIFLSHLSNEHCVLDGKVKFLTVENYIVDKRNEIFQLKWILKRSVTVKNINLLVLKSSEIDLTLELLKAMKIEKRNRIVSLQMLCGSDLYADRFMSLTNLLANVVSLSIQGQPHKCAPSGLEDVEATLSLAKYCDRSDLVIDQVDYSQQFQCQ